MDKLAGYGSDDDYNDSPKYRKTEQASSNEYRNNQHKQTARQVDVNYEEVQMDLSEDSNSDSSKGDSQTRNDRSSKTSRNYDRRDSYREEDKRDSPKYRDYKPRRDDEEDRYRNRDDRDRYRNRNRDDKYKDKYRDDRSSRNYRSRRSSSRERRSRSPRKSDYRSKRSNSRDRDSKYGRRYERSSNKPVLEKPETQKPVEQPDTKPEPDKDRFYMPGITGRFKEQIERRKLLWQKKDTEKKDNTTVAAPTTTGKVWQTTTFAQDTDGKVASKFKRLMGIKESTDGSKGTTDVLKKQEEMFSSMEQQYEVARTATHTMRGVGLGFGSFQR